jgi:hypothetical protein
MSSADQARLSDRAVINVLRTAIRCIEHGQHAKAHELHDRARLELERADAALPVEDDRSRRIAHLGEAAGARS